jgi:hypothetical protein
MLPQFTLINRDAFVTTSGIRGERMVTTSLQQNNLLRQTFYFLPGAAGKYYVVTCSALAAGGDALDPVFEESIKTFETQSNNGARPMLRLRRSCLRPIGGVLFTLSLTRFRMTSAPWRDRA